MVDVDYLVFLQTQGFDAKYIMIYQDNKNVVLLEIDCI